MATCTFIGHSNTPQSAKSELLIVLANLIEHCSVDTFYVGNHGNFDVMVKQTLRQLNQVYPNVKYSIVLAYLPNKTAPFDTEWHETIYPEYLAHTPKRLAIIKRNEWMIENSDFVVAYVKHVGNSVNFLEFSKKKNKTIINIAK